MPIKQVLLPLTAWLCLVSIAHAADPLSAISWLQQTNPNTSLPDTVLLEPPVAGTALQPQIVVTPLEKLLAPVGLVPSSATGLPVDLWKGSSSVTLSRLIARVGVRDNPAMQSLLFTLLLSETRPPSGTDDKFLLARLDRLMELGATDPAQALAEQAGPSNNLDRFQRWFDATLLTGDEDRSCAALTAKPYLSPEYSARIFCAARRGDWQTAALTLEATHALALMPKQELDLLDRFLSPDVFEFAPPLPRPHDPNPLTFRLFETIGERLSTAPLPRAFASADLRDIAGWKAQLEAAERLTRIGALNPNQLLGLYTDRLPAASGGIWDRVAALQRFETALNSTSVDAVSKTLPAVWQAMSQARIEVAFADLFSDKIAQVSLTGDSAELAWHIRLLSPSYEPTALPIPVDTRRNRFLSALAQGKPNEVAATTALEQAIGDGFAANTLPPKDMQILLDSGQLGEAILRSMEMFEQGATGNLSDLSAALVTFRAVGLEDTARRAALQLMLLERT
ncbi:hypothetical protein EBB79_11075 [Parasedimentitalea marina]|uniref:Antifreeze protein n=1 Tax=Parasedimentitalea marina TaxID=2483033 RepID=A0A3T0N2Z5_9RHOB|nr:hypothetical protein [Parasedimentitalea marina]AZV78364.1 hypothetical protein EBB79_11075 [Parasedimentitalea marina]